MSLLFMDSFDHYATADLLEKGYAWEAPSGQTITAATGRRASGGLQFTSNWWLYKSIPASATVIVGVAYNPTVRGAWVLSLSEDGTFHTGVTVNSDGSLSAHRMSGMTTSAAVLGTSAAGLVPVGGYSFLELKATIHDTAGAVVVRVNGTPVITLSGIDTRSGGASGIANRLYVGGYGGTGIYDDLYVLDASGPAPLNDFLGDCRVDARLPSGAGALSGWTPSTGANYACVDEAPPNDDTDYVSTPSPATDTYALQDAAVPGGQLFGVQLLWNIKKLDAGACTVAPVIRQGTTTLPGIAQNPTTSYGYQMQAYGTNPHTGLAWTEADFNADEFGLQRLT